MSRDVSAAPKEWYSEEIKRLLDEIARLQADNHRLMMWNEELQARGCEMQLTCEYGTKEHEPIEYRIVSTFKGPWWWRQRRFWVASDYGKVGPFDDEGEALYFLTQVRADSGD